MAADSLAGVPTQQVELGPGCALMFVSKKADGLCPWLRLVLDVKPKEFGSGFVMMLVSKEQMDSALG